MSNSSVLNSTIIQLGFDLLLLSWLLYTRVNIYCHLKDSDDDKITEMPMKGEFL